MSGNVLPFPDFSGLPKRHATFVGIDSDGCVFDSMPIKTLEHIMPAADRFWGLAWCADALRDCMAFVFLQSKSRGNNRFAGLLRVFDLLPDHPETRRASGPLPATDDLRAFVASGAPLAETALAEAAARTGSAELARVLDWSRFVSADIDAHMRPAPFFPAAAAALPGIHAQSDVTVISYSPAATLEREWSHAGLDRFIDFIAGQECGHKADTLRRAIAANGYAPGRALMLGDTPGDRNAAREAGACFYPILPGGEEASWERFRAEAYPRFLDGAYAGDYERGLADAFDAAFPDLPPWQTRPQHSR
jgi:phosphoglycolate phosphatase-like HAD superfamily hydrolase